jgi:hypothetical protein
MGSAIIGSHLSFTFATTHSRENKIIVSFLPCEENRLRLFRDRVLNRLLRSRTEEIREGSRELHEGGKFINILFTNLYY